MHRLLLTAFGRPARAALETLIAEAKGDDALHPVTVVVPSSYAGLSLRRHDARFGPGQSSGLVNVRFLALNRVAELLGAPFLAEPDRVPLTREARLDATRVALAQAPGVFAPVVSHPSTVRSLAAAFEDLRVADDGALDRLATASPRAASVVACYRHFRATTATTYDDEDQLDAAARLVADHGVPADIGAFLLFCPEHLTPGGHRLVTAFAARTFTGAVIGLTGDPVADDPARELAGWLTDALGPPREAGPDRPRLGDRVVSAPDPESEVREAVRALVERVDRGGTLHDVAVVWRVAEPYARLLHERLAEAGVPVHGASPKRLADTVTGRTLISLVDLVDRDLRRDDVLAFLAGARIRETPDGHSVPVVRWDRISREAGVVHGAGQWRDRLARYREQLLLRFTGEEPDWLDDEVERIVRVERFVDELATLVTATSTTWADWSTWARGLLDRYIGTPPRSWPEAEVAAHGRIVDRLAALGALVSRLPVDRATFRSALGEELEQTVDHVGRFGCGVLLAGIGSLTATDYHTVFVVGAAEGRLPPAPRDDPLLPDRERAVTDGQVALRAGATARERRAYLAALAAASDEVVLSWARGDPVGQRAQLPSRWVVETMRARTGTSITARELAEADTEPVPGLRVIRSFAASLHTPAAAISIPDLELRALEVARVDGSGPDVHPLTSANPTLAHGFRTLHARALPRFSEFDGMVGARERLLPDADRPLSPSRIEDWAQCPFRYFLANLLHLRSMDAPEDIDTIDPRVRGTLVHDVLDAFVREMPPRTAPDQAWSAEERDWARGLTNAACDRAAASGQTGRPLLWELERARIVREVTRALDTDERIRAERGLLTVGTEIGFGGRPDDEWKPLTVELGDAHVTFRGRIDRVDAAPDSIGQVVVYDYKTGSAEGLSKLAEDPVKQGTKLQLAIYGLVAEREFPGRPVRAEYWHTRQPAGKELRGIDMTDAGPRVREVLATVTESVAGGTFPAHPGPENPYFNSFDECRYCDFDRLCSPDRGSAFDAKRDDPAVARFVELRGLREDA